MQGNRHIRAALKTFHGVSGLNVGRQCLIGEAHPFCPSPSPRFRVFCSVENPETTIPVAPGVQVAPCEVCAH